MLVKEFDDNAEELISLAKEIRERKRPDYTLGSENVLRNFDTIAVDLDLPPEKIVWVYMKKHLDAILSHVNYPNYEASEPIEARFADTVNYILLLYSVIKRRNATQHYAVNKDFAVKDMQCTGKYTTTE